MTTSELSKTVAFYLPQFHEIPENDAWWGNGFTEWTNVRRAVPQFSGHEQPRIPAAPLSYYDLTDKTILAMQVDMAKSADVNAFCFYHYWFDGARLLEVPLDNFASQMSHFQFCICWANENWTRRWDGKQHEILMDQTYSAGFPEAVFSSFQPYLAKSNYLRFNGRAVLLVHRADQLPNAPRITSIWRNLAIQQGVGPLWLVASETVPGLDPRRLGFDAVAEFPPAGDNNLANVLRRPPPSLNPAFRGRLLSYERLKSGYVSRPAASFPRHPGVIPSWDNTPRRGNRATIFAGSSPASYASWLAAARAREESERPRGLVFVNAWNEWAEGAYLEPDTANGQEYLRATRRGYSPPQVMHPVARRVGRPSIGYAYSMAQAAASTMKYARRGS
jgi:lipopolysaccharide biosynthesis protein